MIFVNVFEIELSLLLQFHCNLKSVWSALQEPSRMSTLESRRLGSLLRVRTIFHLTLLLPGRLPQICYGPFSSQLYWWCCFRASYGQWIQIITLVTNLKLLCLIKEKDIFSAFSRFTNYCSSSGNDYPDIYDGSKAGTVECSYDYCKCKWV